MYNFKLPDAENTALRQIIPIHEIFISIQGELPFPGHTTLFIRVGGCNRTCDWCDTGYTPNKSPDVTPESVRMMPKANYEQLVDITLQAYNVAKFSSIEITGGEPLIFKEELRKYLTALYDRRPKIDLFANIETNGELLTRGYIDSLPNFVSICMSPKLPSAGKSSKAQIKDCVDISLQYSELKAYTKFVIANESDYTHLRNILWEHYSGRSTTVILQPEYSKMSYADLFRMTVENKLPYKTLVGIQMHKYVSMQ